MSNPFDAVLDGETGNPFDAAAGELEREQIGSAQDGMRQGLTLDPQQRARALEQSQITGLPVDTAERNLDELDRAQKLAAVPWDEVDQSPALRGFLSDPNQAAAAQEDVQALLDLRRSLEGGQPQPAPTPQPAEREASLLEILGARFTRGRRAAFEIPSAAQPMILAGLGLREATLDERRVWQIAAGRPQAQAEREGMLDDILGAPLEQVPILARLAGGALLGGAGGAAIGAGAGSLLPGAGTIAGAGIGFTLGAKAGSAYSAFWIEAGNAYQEFGQLADENGEPIPENVKAAGATVVGAINAGMELVGFQAIASRIPGLKNLAGAGRKATTAAIAKRMANPALRSALLSSARSVLSSVGIEAATEIAQEAVNVEAGRVISGQGVGLTGDELARVGEAGLQAALGAGPLVTAGQTVSITMERIAQARQNQAQMEQASAAVASAKIRELSPAVFRTLTDELAREAGVHSVGIPVDALVEAYGTLGLTPESMAAELQIPEARVNEALATGGDLQVPVGAYFSLLEPRFGANLLPDLRLRPEDLTAREAERAESGLEATVERAMRREVEPTIQAQHADAAQEALGLEPLFTDPDGAGMTREEFESYKAAASSARVAAQAQLQKEIEREERNAELVRKSEARTHARVREDFTEEVTREVDARPVYQARAFLELPVPREKGAEAAPARLDRDRMVSLYGEDIVEQLPSNLVQKNGMHPDLVADLFGFENGYTLVRELIASDRDKAISEGVEAKMVERFGDFATDGRLEEAALDAAQNTEQIRLLQREERALARVAGDGQTTPRAIAQAAARRMISEMQVVALSPQRFRGAAQQAGRLAVEAVAARDYEQALAQKRRQILNLALEQESRAVRDEMKSARQFLSKFNEKSTRERIGKAGGDYLDQIDALLERFDFRPVSIKAAQKRASLAEWITAREAEGEEVIIPENLRREAFRVPASQMVVGDLRGLRESVENIEHLAQLKNKLIGKKKQRELDAAAEEISTEVAAQFPEPLRSARFTPTKMEEIKKGARWFDASLTKVEFLIDALAGNDPDSALRRYVWDPLVAAQSDYAKRIDDYAGRIERLRRSLGDERVRAYDAEILENRLNDTDGRPLKLTKWNLLVIALNMGNASNLEKLLKGYGWDAKTLTDVLDAHMVAEDWRFIQGVWDEIDTLWPEIAALEKRLTGVAPPKIESTEIQTPFGKFSGGYFPVVYDSDRSRLGQRIEALQIVPGVAEGYTRASTGHGHTKARTEVVGPLRIDQSVIGNHLDQVILDLTHREAIQDASRVLARKEVDQAISRAVGTEFSYQRFWVPWLKGIARDTADPGPIGIWFRMARWARLRGTVFKLGFRETTLLAQASGHFNGLRTLKESVPSGATTYWLRGIFQAMGRLNLASAFQTYRDVVEASDFMASRSKTMTRDIRDVVRTASRTRKVSDAVGSFSLSLIARVQIFMVDLPLWLAAHMAGREGMNMTEDQAIRFADSMVRKSQGGGTKLDLSAFERGDRGGEMLKALSMFYGYNNTVYNQLRSNVRELRSVRDVPDFLAAYFFYAAGPGLVSAMMYGILYGRFPDEEDDDFDSKARKELAKALIGPAASTFPFLRDYWVIGMGEKPHAASALEIFRQEAEDFVHVRDGQDLMFDALRGGSLIAGLPLDRALRLAEKAADQD